MKGLSCHFFIQMLLKGIAMRARGDLNLPALRGALPLDGALLLGGLSPAGKQTCFSRVGSAEQN
jgi:hypothetical protein